MGIESIYEDPLLSVASPQIDCKWPKVTVAGVIVISSEKRRGKMITFMRNPRGQEVIDHHAATTIDVVDTA
jgi:hypothetical protein